jgi:UDP-glucuronate 4-epimerase
MKILVTGAAGFIGSHVAEALLARGDQVAALDNLNDYYDPARKRANLRPLLGHSAFAFHKLDVRDEGAMARLCTEGAFDAVVHLAAMAGVRYSIERAPLYVDVNIRGTVNLLEAVRKAGTLHVVFASTSSVYGRSAVIPFREDDIANEPLAPYPATKLAAEQMGYAYHNLFGLSFTALRFFSVYGPRGRPDMMPYHVIDSIVRDRTFNLFEAGEMYRDWTYVADIVAGVVAAVDRPMGYQVINLGRGEPVRMADFVELIEGLVGKRALIDAPPAPASEPPITYAEIARARELLGYEPTTPVAVGLSRLWDWYQEEILATDG